MTAAEARRPHPALPLALFCGLLALVLLAYAGRTFSIDEQSVMATADSLARFGRADTDLLAFTHWDLPPPSGLGRFGVDGEYYSKKPPGMALVAAPLFWLGLRLTWLGNQQAALLAAPLLTVLSATILYGLCARLGYHTTSALLAAVLMVCATPALIYSRMLFTEPLALAGLALALYACDGVTETAERSMLVCGFGLALAIAANAVYVAIVPLFVIYTLCQAEPDSLPRITRMTRIGRSFAQFAPFVAKRLLVIVPLALALVALAAFNRARFGDWLASGYHFDSGEGFTTPLWLGAYGLLFSPARGLLWFVPLSWLAVPGWLRLRRRRARLAWLSLALLIWHVVVFGAWWNWAGGVSWGPRFLVPLMPVVGLCCLPVVETALTERKRGWQIALGLAALLSIGVQTLGAVADVNQIEGELGRLSPWTADAPPGFNHNWAALNSPSLSYIAFAARQLGEGPRQIAWWNNGKPDWPVIGILLIVVALAAFLTARLSAGLSLRHGWIITTALLGASAVVVIIALARLPHAPVGLWGPLAELPPALAESQPGDVVIALTPDLTWALLDVDRRPPVYGLPRNAGTDDPTARASFEAALRGSRRAWLLTYDPSPADWYSADLGSRGELLYDNRVDGGYRLRLYSWLP